MYKLRRTTPQADDRVPALTYFLNEREELFLIAQRHDQNLGGSH